MNEVTKQKKRNSCAILTIATVILLTGCGNRSADNNFIKKDENSQSVSMIDENDSDEFYGSDKVYMSYSEKKEKADQLYKNNIKGQESTSLFKSAKAPSAESQKLISDIESIMKTYDENEIIEKIKEQCECIKESDIDGFTESFSEPFTRFIIENRRTGQGNKLDSFKEWISYKIFSEGNEVNDHKFWPDIIDVEDITYKYYNAREDYIEINYDFKLRKSDIFGEVTVYQSMDYDEVIVERVYDETDYTRAHMNSLAKIIYNEVFEYLAENKVGYDVDYSEENKKIEEFLQSDVFQNVNSINGLDFDYIGDMGEGDKYLLDYIKREKITVNSYAPVLPFRFFLGTTINESKNDLIIYVQVQYKDDPNIIGQYPYPTDSIDDGKVVFGERYEYDVKARNN